MKNNINKITLALVLVLLLALTGCGKQNTSTTITELVKGHLDALYLGEATDSYLELEDTTQEQVQTEYLDALRTESAFFCYYIGAIEKPEYYETLSEATRAKVEELYKTMYQSAKYEVRDPQKNEEESYSVEVVVSPIDAVDRAFDELNSQEYQPFIDIVSKYNTGELTEEEFFESYADVMAELVSSKLEDVGYLDPETIIVNINVDTEGKFTVTPDDIIMVDSKIISYSNLNYDAEAEHSH